MFSVREKREIAGDVQKILRATNHPELPQDGEIEFCLHVNGAESWSWADITSNGTVTQPTVNPWNELQDSTGKVGDPPRRNDTKHFGNMYAKFDEDFLALIDENGTRIVLDLPVYEALAKWMESLKVPQRATEGDCHVS